jgi:hypothetical protein
MSQPRIVENALTHNFSKNIEITAFIGFEILPISYPGPNWYGASWCSPYNPDCII